MNQLVWNLKSILEAHDYGIITYLVHTTNKSDKMVL